MQAIGKRLTYANVVSTLALFLVLAGGAAYAAKVGKKSVGPAQLKANAVTTAKIKANAVTTRKIKKNAVANAKIKDGAIESAKIADGSVTRTDLAEATHAVLADRLRSARQLDRAARKRQTGALPARQRHLHPAGRQRRHRDGRARRQLQTDLHQTPARFRHTSSPTPPNRRNCTTLNEAVAAGQFADETGEVTGGRVKLGSYGALFQPATATSHTLSLVAILHCSTGDGATATFGAADVISTKK